MPSKSWEALGRHKACPYGAVGGEVRDRVDLLGRMIMVVGEARGYCRRSIWGGGGQAQGLPLRGLLGGLGLA